MSTTDTTHNCKLCNCKLSYSCVMVNIGEDNNHNNQIEYYCKSCYVKGFKKL
jgi:hypothetical protein